MIRRRRIPNKNTNSVSKPKPPKTIVVKKSAGATNILIKENYAEFLSDAFESIDFARTVITKPTYTSIAFIGKIDGLSFQESALKEDIEQYIMKHAQIHRAKCNYWDIIHPDHVKTRKKKHGSTRPMSTRRRD